MKRSLNFRGRPGKHLTLANVARCLKTVGKTDEEIIAILSDTSPVQPEDQADIDMFNKAIADAQTHLDSKER